MKTIPIRLVSTESRLIAELNVAIEAVHVSELSALSAMAANALGYSIITSHFANGVLTAWVS